AETALRALSERAPDVTLMTVGGAMGADAARAVGIDPVVVTDPEGAHAEPTATTAADTRAAVRAMVEAGIDLLLFVGGDGTATDIGTELDAIDAATPMLGVPAGVKIYSSVFGVTPEDAGRIAATFESVTDREVLDVDEDAVREGEVRTTLRAVRPVPIDGSVQASKQLSGGDGGGIAAGIAAGVDREATYVLGPGSTVGTVARELGFEPSPLGVDVWRDGVLVRDASEDGILTAIRDPTVVIVSPIGGQGVVLGRGNQQLSSAVLERSTVEIVATPSKLAGLDCLRVDTDDPAFDAAFRGWHRVRTGRNEYELVEVR
ncbi:N-acetylglucosamine-1-phosphate uridyltransferase, partial [Halobacteriales archaeon SW_7_68_16]